MHKFYSNSAVHHYIIVLTIIYMISQFHSTFATIVRKTVHVVCFIVICYVHTTCWVKPTNQIL